MFQILKKAERHRPSFLRSERGSVAVSGALVLPVLLGIGGLAIEYGDALVTRAETQRTADLAAHAGSLAFQSGGSDAMTEAVQRVALLNGVPADGVSAVVDNASASGPVVRVTITTPRELVLARFVASGSSVDVTVRSAATLEHGAPACLQALDPGGSGITLSGGTSISTDDCAVSSNATVTASGSGTIVTKTLTYDSATAPSFTGGASLRAPDGGTPQIVRQPSPDPFADNAGVAAARQRLVAVAALPAPAAPSVATGPNIDFGWNASATKAAAVSVGCSADFQGGTWTFACPANKAEVNLGNLTIGGGINVDFALNGAATTTYRFSGSVRNTGTRMRFGPGIYEIAGGLTTGGGTTTSFGAGTFRIGRSTAGCSGPTGFSICNTASLTFDGPSDFVLQGGIRNTGGATLVLGAGSGNSLHIGAASNGDAFTLDGSSNTTLGDTSGAGDRFRVVGNITTAGGSCFVIGAATNHDIAGRLSMEGGVTMGSGLYAIDGYLHLGASGGGSVWCQGQAVSLRALDVTIAVSGARLQGTNSNCNGQAAFCAGAGYSGLLLVAPTSGTYAGLALIGPLSAGVTAGATFTGGASGGQISGAFYVPNGPILLSGGASAGGAGGTCLQIVGATVTLQGGTTAASDCVQSDAAGGATVRLLE